MRDASVTSGGAAPAPAYNPMSGNASVNVGTNADTGKSTYAPAAAASQQFNAVTPPSAPATVAPAYNPMSGNSSINVGTSSAGKSTYAPVETAKTSSAGSAPAKNIPGWPGTFSKPQSGLTGKQFAGAASDILLGTGSFKAAGREAGAAITGKDASGKSLSLAERAKSGLGAVGNAALGTTAVASTLAMAVPVVGDVAGAGVKVGVAGIKLANAAKAASAAKTAGTVSKIAPKLVANRAANVITKTAAVAPAKAVKAATSITKAAANAPSGVVKAATDITKSTAAKAAASGTKAATEGAAAASKYDVVGGAENITKNASKGENNLGGGGVSRPTAPKAPTGSGGSAPATRSTTVTEAPSSGSFTPSTSRASAFQGEADQAMTATLPKPTIKKTTNSLPGAPGYKAPSVKPASSLPGAPGYTKTPGVVKPSTGYPTSTARSTTIGDRASAPSFTPKTTNLPAVRSTSVAPTAAKTSTTKTAVSAPKKTAPTSLTSTTKSGLTSTSKVTPIPGSDYQIMRPELNIQGLNALAQGSKAINNITKPKTVTPSGAPTVDSISKQFKKPIAEVTPTPTTEKNTKTIEKVKLNPDAWSETSIGSKSTTEKSMDKSNKLKNNKFNIGDLGTIGAPGIKNTTNQSNSLDFSTKLDPTPKLEPKPEPKTENPKYTKTTTKTEEKKKKPRIRFKSKKAEPWTPSSII